MAAAVKKELGVEAELVEGSGGVFDITADGIVLFSKAAAGRFPEAEEILAPVRKRLPPR